MTDITKHCRKCGCEKPIEQFTKNKTCRHGRLKICKICSNKYGNTWKNRNRDRLATRRRQLYADRWGPINRENERKRKEQYPLQVRCQLLRGGMRDRSKELSLPFDKDKLTVRYLMERVNEHPFCECCGKKLDLNFKLNNMKNDLSPSIDRLVPKKGYVIENISILCWRCNNLKRDATIEELTTIIKWLEKKRAVVGMTSWGDQIS